VIHERTYGEDYDHLEEKEEEVMDGEEEKEEKVEE